MTWRRCAAGNPPYGTCWPQSAQATPDVAYLSFVLVLSALAFLLGLSAPGFGARPSCPPARPLTASLIFLTDVVIRWLTALVPSPPENAALEVLGPFDRAVAMRTVVLWPLVTAVAPKGLSLIATPGVVCVTV